MQPQSYQLETISKISQVEYLKLINQRRIKTISSVQCMEITKIILAFQNIRINKKYRDLIKIQPSLIIDLLLLQLTTQKILQFQLSISEDDLNDYIGLQCFSHQKKVQIRTVEDWRKVSGGGCEQDCNIKFNCAIFVKNAAEHLYVDINVNQIALCHVTKNNAKILMISKFLNAAILKKQNVIHNPMLVQSVRIIVFQLLHWDENQYLQRLQMKYIKQEIKQEKLYKITITIIPINFQLKLQSSKVDLSLSAQIIQHEYNCIKNVVNFHSYGVYKLTQRVYPENDDKKKLSQDVAFFVDNIRIFIINFNLFLNCNQIKQDKLLEQKIQDKDKNIGSNIKMNVNLFVKGDCIAFQYSKQVDCEDQVGGQQHQLMQNNQLACEIDGVRIMHIRQASRVQKI
ncbi:hypothetical protein pb186bvf_018477 [Paramecium bursaria]